MLASLLLTVTGIDKPGLVDSLAEVIQRHGGNWEESRMAHLAGYFAGIVCVSLPEDAHQTLMDELAKLETRGLSVVARRGVATSVIKKAKPLTFELLGTDRPGIVREISGVLAQRNVNVEELHTERAPAPHAGDTLFKAVAHLSCPDTEVEPLRLALEELAGDMMVDISLRER